MFHTFPPIPRLARDVVVTEKIDGTNASVHILHENEPFDGPAGILVSGYRIVAASRTRYITPEDDNYGFAAWVRDHSETLVEGLGAGSHFGEWWGRGIQRGYGLSERHFSLFNTARWNHICPPYCRVVPVLYQGPFDTSLIEAELQYLKRHGSVAAPGFPNPEGIVVYHTAARMGFKRTCERDEQRKSEYQDPLLGEFLVLGG